MSQPRYFVGIGCRRGCSEMSLRQLLEQTLSAHAILIELIGGIASIESKHEEVGLLALAVTLNVPLHFFSAIELTSFEDRVEAGAAAVQRETGVSNIAETCALALAEISTKKTAELVIRKCKSTEATIALAEITEKTT